VQGWKVFQALLAELNLSPDRDAWWGGIEKYFGASYIVLAVWLGPGLMLCGRVFARAGRAPHPCRVDCG